MGGGRGGVGGGGWGVLEGGGGGWGGGGVQNEKVQFELRRLEILSQILIPNPLYTNNHA